MLERSRTMRAAPTLRRRKPPIVLETYLRAFPEAGELRTDQAVAVDLHPCDLRRHAEPVDRVVEVDQRQVLAHLDERLMVELDPAVELQDRARLVRRLVDRGVRVAAVVLRALRVDELVGVAVRVDAARPADRELREVAGLSAVERRRELGRVEDLVEADRFLLALDQRAEARGDRIRAEH